MDLVLARDVEALITNRQLTLPSTYTAGAGTGTTTGVTIDREGFSNGSLPNSIAADVAWEATLATGKTLSIGYAIQTSDDNSSWTDYQTASPAVVGTGSTAASVVSGNLKVSASLTSARRYVRMNTTLAMSATQTDTSAAQAFGTLAGFDRNPSPA